MTSTSSSNYSFRKTVQSNRQETSRLIHEAVDYFVEMKRKNFYHHLDEYYFRLALDELVENAMIHGNLHEAKKLISVEINHENGKAEITVTDEGNGFIPSTLSNPRAPGNLFKSSGRGLFIVQKIGEVKWNDSGNRVSVRL